MLQNLDASCELHFIHLFAYIPERHMDHHIFQEGDTIAGVIGTLKGAARLAAEQYGCIPVPLYTRELLHLCRLLASYIPDEHVPVKHDSRAFDQLLTSAVRFFKVSKLTKIKSAKASKLISISVRPGSLPALTTKKVRAAASGPTDIQHRETESTGEEAVVDNKDDGSSEQRRDRSVKKLRLPSRLKKEVTGALNEVDLASTAKGNPQCVAPSKEAPPKEKSKKRKASEELQATEDVDVQERTQLKKPKTVSPAKQKEGEGKDGEGVKKKSKLHGSNSAAKRAPATANVAQTPNEKAQGNIIQPTATPPKKLSVTDISKSASSVPARMAKRQRDNERVLRELRGGRVSDWSSSESDSDSDSDDDLSAPAKPAPSQAPKPVGGASAAVAIKASDSDSGIESEVEFVSSKACTQRNVPLPVEPEVRRPMPTVDPTAQVEENRVYKVDVYRSMLLEDANRIHYLESLLDTVGIGEMRRRQIQKRLEQGDDLNNAIRATCSEKVARRIV